MWRLTLVLGVLCMMSDENSFSNVRGLAANLSDLTVASSRMIYCYALKLWSHICVTCLSCCFQDSVSLFCCAGARCLGSEGWLHTYEMVT